MYGSLLSDQASMDGAKTPSDIASTLPAELLQSLGEHLNPKELHNSRLVCKQWATALAVSMPTLTMALPQQASRDIFRQPLVLCSSGLLGSTQSASYSAVPRAPVHRPVHLSTASAGQRPTPFATKRGQQVFNSTAANSSRSASVRQSPSILAAGSLPPGTLANTITHPNSTIQAAGAAMGQPSPRQHSSDLSSWSSLPASGLKTCSSLQQLRLQLSGTPPSPEDLLDLSTLPNLTHLSLRQVSNSGVMASILAQPAGSSRESAAPAVPTLAALDNCSDTSTCDCTSDNSSRDPASGPSSSAMPVLPRQPSVSHLAAAGASALASFHIISPRTTATSDSKGLASLSSSRGSSSSGLGELLGQVDAVDAFKGSQTCVASHWGSNVDDREDPSHSRYVDVVSINDFNLQEAWRQVALAAQETAAAAAAMHQAVHDSNAHDDTQQLRDQQEVRPANNKAPPMVAPAAAEVPSAAPVTVPALQQCVSCSVLTPEHIQALVQLPRLSSLELHPKDGYWDAAGTGALLQLSLLTGLTRLVVTWGNADSVTAPLSHQEAVEQAHGVQLPLQRCLLGLAQLKELELRGSAAVDVQVLQGMQQLQKLTAEALIVVNSDVLLLIQEQQRAAAAVAELVGDQEGAWALQLRQRSPKWGVLPHLRHLHVIHPGSDISLLLQGTKTPVLSTVGFVARSSGDFARLLSQHCRKEIRVLHLVFPSIEPWHTIAVVRLPTALPMLQSLTLEGGFWLPNSLIVGLGVMEVPLEELSIKCKLAVPCLDRLQHLSTVTKLGLHHVSAPPGPPDGLITKDVMLQLPAKLLPPGLRKLEISNGWILH